jgi:predicted HTH transcriptional regulator
MDVSELRQPKLRQEIKKDLERYMELFRDPVVLGELVYKLVEERENTNRLLKTLLQRLEALEQKLSRVSHDSSRPTLSQVEEQILNFVKQRGSVTAEDVRKAFGYKGRNAASSHLNKLYRLGLVKKFNKGRTTVFQPL